MYAGFIYRLPVLETCQMALLNYVIIDLSESTRVNTVVLCAVWRFSFSK